MGNCIRKPMRRDHGEENGDLKRQAEGQNGAGKGGKIRIKIVLTKEELEWMMFQLKDKSQGKRLEDVLEEIGRGRGKAADAWKPSLDRILETDEAPKF